MSSDVIMPQMGESIAEGTVTKWLKNIGDHVKRDEPLFEISTDKVDAEIPSPAEGIVLEIVVPEGETVPINTVVARIGKEGEVAVQGGPSTPAVEATATPARAAPEKVPARPQQAPPSPAAMGGGDGGAPVTAEAIIEDRRKTKSSPLVRKIVREHSVHMSLIAGTGSGGRVTKRDILDYINDRGTVAPPVTSAPAAPPTPAMAPPTAPPVAFPPGERVVKETMSIMRKKIAEHMIQSRRTSAHVQTWQECDMHNVVLKRQRMKEQFQAEGVNLTYTAFIAEALVKALQAFPKLNASLEGDDTIVYHKDVNLGIAVALDWGLIVPVVKHAEQMNLLGLASSVNDLAERARSKRLSPDDVQGGTFTITNPGVFGSLMGAPIINQPQVAILGVGVIKKRPVVIDDAIAIRPIMYLSLSFDHRLVDGADAAKFLSFLVNEMEKP
jgi:2-oxoglutarate dehydrogenase E2 component (dihydrolipoamide succinyltransferase)